MQSFFSELEQAVTNVDPSRYDYSYDQVVCMGEILSSRIFACYLQQNNIPHEWIDIRKVFRTDDTYRDAVIHWHYSKVQADATIGDLLKQGKTVVTQGFIGATGEGDSVTLGREGSDYTAAVLAAMLHLESVTILERCGWPAQCRSKAVSEYGKDRCHLIQ